MVKSTRWITNNAIRELNQQGIQMVRELLEACISTWLGIHYSSILVTKVVLDPGSLSRNLGSVLGKVADKLHDFN